MAKIEEKNSKILAFLGLQLDKPRSLIGQGICSRNETNYLKNHRREILFVHLPKINWVLPQ